MSEVQDSMDPDTDLPLLQAESIVKTFQQGGSKLSILNNLNLTLEPGELVALTGPSGSGKSTLLQILGLLDQPSSGRVILGDEDAGGLRDSVRTRLRRQYLGFVYQFHYLQPEFSALENVMIPQMVNKVRKKDARERARILLAQMGLEERMSHRPARLSGGEQQRVAIARALANDPYVILADEPTGNLDEDTSDRVFSILIERAREAGIGAIIATHNMDLADRMDRVLELKNGRLYPL